MIRRIKNWLLVRKHRHFHWVEGPLSVGVYDHSHLDQEIDHEHTFDEVCKRWACLNFPIHRVHPRPPVR